MHTRTRTHSLAQKIFRYINLQHQERQIKDIITLLVLKNAT